MGKCSATCSTSVAETKVQPVAPLWRGQWARAVQPVALEAVDPQAWRSSDCRRGVALSSRPVSQQAASSVVERMNNIIKIIASDTLLRTRKFRMSDCQKQDLMNNTSLWSFCHVAHAKTDGEPHMAFEMCSSGA